MDRIIHRLKTNVDRQKDIQTGSVSIYCYLSCVGDHERPQEDFALISAICFLGAQVPLDIKKLQEA